MLRIKLYLYLVNYNFGLADYIDLTDVTCSSEILSEIFWIADLHLRMEDKRCLEGDWLTDRIINVAQKLLQKAHPHVGNLQSSILGETLAFTVQRGDFVQILNIANSHWITVSSDNHIPPTIPVQTFNGVSRKTNNNTIQWCKKGEIKIQ